MLFANAESERTLRFEVVLIGVDPTNVSNLNYRNIAFIFIIIIFASSITFIVNVTFGAHHVPISLWACW